MGTTHAPIRCHGARARHPGCAAGLAVDVIDVVLDWYDVAARDLPWRTPAVGPWAVLVSEVMLQQTPVARVLPAWEQWMARWPTPGALAAEAPGEAVLAWGRLGYPRRALRLHQAAVAIVDRHGGQVPAEHDALRALPGVGEYTAAAVAAFAFGQRHVVLDTNVRRVLARVLSGQGAVGASTTAAERRLAAEILPADPATLGPLERGRDGVGGAGVHRRPPGLRAVPRRRSVRLAGRRTPGAEVVPRAQAWAGTDRRSAAGCWRRCATAAPEPVSAAVLDGCWDEPMQRARALDSLVADGLIEPLPDGRYALPARRPA